MHYKYAFMIMSLLSVDIALSMPMGGNVPMLCADGSHGPCSLITGVPLSEAAPVCDPKIPGSCSVGGLEAAYSKQHLDAMLDLYASSSSMKIGGHNAKHPVKFTVGQPLSPNSLVSKLMTTKYKDGEFLPFVAAKCDLSMYKKFSMVPSEFALETMVNALASGCTEIIKDLQIQKRSLRNFGNFEHFAKLAVYFGQLDSLKALVSSLSPQQLNEYMVILKKQSHSKSTVASGEVGKINEELLQVLEKIGSSAGVTLPDWSQHSHEGSKLSQSPSSDSQEMFKLFKSYAPLRELAMTGTISQQTMKKHVRNEKSSHFSSVPRESFYPIFGELGFDFGYENHAVIKSLVSNLRQETIPIFEYVFAKGGYSRPEFQSLRFELLSKLLTQTGADKNVENTSKAATLLLKSGGLSKQNNQALKEKTRLVAVLSGNVDLLKLVEEGENISQPEKLLKLASVHGTSNEMLAFILQNIESSGPNSANLVNKSLRGLIKQRKCFENQQQCWEMIDLMVKNGAKLNSADETEHLILNAAESQFADDEGLKDLAMFLNGKGVHGVENRPLSNFAYLRLSKYPKTLSYMRTIYSKKK